MDRLDPKQESITFLDTAAMTWVRFWDVPNKVVGSRDVTSNEGAVYKDKLAGGATDSDI